MAETAERELTEVLEDYRRARKSAKRWFVEMDRLRTEALGILDARDAGAIERLRIMIELEAEDA